MNMMSGVQPGQCNDQPFDLPAQPDGLLSGRLRGRSSSLPTGTVLGLMRHNSIQCTYAPVLDGLDMPLGSTQEQTLVHLLLEKVTSLSHEKQCLSEQNLGLQQKNGALQQEVVALQRDNQQLNSLVTDLSDTLQQQQHQARLLLHLQRQHMIKASGRVASPPQAPLAPAPQQLKHATILAQQQHLAQQMVQRGLALDSAESADTGPRMASLLKRDQQHGQQQQQGQVRDDDEVCTEASATLPFLDLQQQARQQQDMRSNSQHVQQQRVAEWLQERGWQEWQGRLPLEPMSSSSSSSLMMALEESMLRN